VLYQGTAVADSSVDQNPGGGVQEPPGRAAVNWPAVWPLRANQPAVAAATAPPAAVAFGKAVAQQSAKTQQKATAKAKGDPTAIDDAAPEVLSVTVVADAVAQVLSGNQTADADAGAQVMIGNQTAVADAGAQCFDLEYFQQRVPVTTTYKNHMEALEWFRQVAEAAGVDHVFFSNVTPNLFAQIVHPAGMADYVAGKPTIPWWWQDIVAQMDDASRQHVVQGVNRSRGLISCRIQKTCVYDHRRMDAEARAGRFRPDGFLYEWDFVVVREDGTEVWMHPAWSDTNISGRDCRTMVCDEYSPHKTNHGWNLCWSRGYIRHVRGGGCTPIVQPCDTDLHERLRRAYGVKESRDSTTVAEITGGSSSTA
jgi:hypothetical protein